MDVSESQALIDLNFSPFIHTALIISQAIPIMHYSSRMIWQRQQHKSYLAVSFPINRCWSIINTSVVRSTTHKNQQTQDFINIQY